MSAMPVCGAVVLSQEVEGLEELGWGGVCFCCRYCCLVFCVLVFRLHVCL